MKLSNGRKVAMHNTPECEERSRLHSECSRLLGEWLTLKDEVKMTRKNDPSYAEKVREMKHAHGKHKAAQEAVTQHALTHRCW
jgi:hypothetical protein